MKTVKVIYWSGTGNTEQMAQAVAQGIEAKGASADVKTVSEVQAADLADDKAFALGCPAMGAEELEETEMEPFMCALEGSLSGKQVVLFGSYGWGDESWMRSWEERVKAAGATVVTGTGIAAMDAPDDAATEQCKQAGSALAELAGE